MAYNGSIELISGIKQKNNGKFPLVDASAIRVDDNSMLDATLDTLKGDITSLETLLRTIQEKLNSGSSSVDTVTVNEINDMIVEYFENKTVSEVEA